MPRRSRLAPASRAGLRWLRAAARELRSPGDREWDTRYRATIRTERYHRALLATAILAGAALGNLVVVGTASKPAMLVAGLERIIGAGTFGQGRGHDEPPRPDHFDSGLERGRKHRAVGPPAEHPQKQSRG
jgi:hypothetical protein